MTALRLTRSPIAALARWWDLRCVQARIRWAEGDIALLERQQVRDADRLAFLRRHLGSLRVRRAIVER